MNLDAFVSRAQAAMVTGVSPDAIGKWWVRGWLPPDGVRRHLRVRRCGDGTLQYCLGEILDAERDTRMSGHSRRGSAQAINPIGVAWA